jgi:hypothetical protein
MSFLAKLNPFHKENIADYKNVLVPLANAQRHSTVTAEYDRRRSQDGRTSSGDAGSTKKKESEDESGVLSSRSAAYSPFTVEGLRAEVYEDVGASGHDTAYDREFYFSEIWGSFVWRADWVQ